MTIYLMAPIGDIILWFPVDISMGEIFANRISSTRFLLGTKMMLGLISNMKRKLVVGVASVLFVTTKSARDCGSYTIAVLRESHTKRSLINICLRFGHLVFQVMVKFLHPFLLIHRR